MIFRVPFHFCVKTSPRSKPSAYMFIFMQIKRSFPRGLVLKQRHIVGPQPHGTQFVIYDHFFLSRRDAQIISLRKPRNLYGHPYGQDGHRSPHSEIKITTCLIVSNFIPFIPPLKLVLIIFPSTQDGWGCFHLWDM